MGLETATWIDQLDPSNPTPTDPKSQGDDHLRLTKSVLQNQFPSLGQVAVTSSAEDLNGGLFDDRLAGFASDGGHPNSITELGLDPDIDTYLVNSIYQVSSANTNLPSGWGGANELGFLHTMLNPSKANGVQVLYSRSNTDLIPRIYQRGRNNNTWHTWKLVVEGGAFTERLAGYLDTGILEQWNTNVDDISVNSAYGVNAAATTGLPSDFEAGWQGEITTLFRTATRATQMLYGVVNTPSVNKIWMRNLNTTWGAWILVVDGGAFTQRLAGYLDTGFTQAYSGNIDDLTVNARYDISAVSVTGAPADFFDTGFLEIIANQNGTFALQRLSGYTGGAVNKIWQRVLGSAWTLVVSA